MSFCDLCSGLTIAKLYPPNVYYHASSPSALETSADSCSLCKMMHKSMKEWPYYEQLVLDFDGASPEPPDGRLSKLPEAPLKLQIILAGSEAVLVPSNSEIRNLRGKRANWEECQYIQQIGIWLHSRIARCAIGVAVEEGTQWPRYFTKRMTVNETRRRVRVEKSFWYWDRLLYSWASSCRRRTL
jgi:hypothetical protein